MLQELSVASDETQVDERWDKLKPTDDMSVFWELM